MLLLVDEKLFGVVRSLAKLLPTHDIGVAAERLRVRRLEPLVIGFVEHIAIGRQLAPPGVVIGPLQRTDLRLKVDLSTCFKQQNVEAVSTCAAIQPAAPEPTMSTS